MRNLKRPFLLFALVLANTSAPGQDNGVYSWRNFVGQPGSSGTNDGTGSAARFSMPSGVVVDSAGNAYVADHLNNTIRQVTSGGVVMTLAGSPGVSGTNDGTGSAARFNMPGGVALDSAGNLYVSDYWNSTIRRVTGGGVVTTLAGSAGRNGTNDGTGSAARFRQPTGVAVDSTDNVYVADNVNHTIRKVTSAGVVTTLAGSAGASGTNDGTGSAARFYYPFGMAVDSAGNVYVGDTFNHTIRKVTSDGVVTTLAGSAGASGTNDGTGSAARFCYPDGVAVDSAGNVYVADYGNQTLRKATGGGVVTTIGGSAGVSGGADGVGNSAQFHSPVGITVDTNGWLYVADCDNNRISKGMPAPSIRRSGNSIVVFWPSPAPGFVLQTNASVANASGWSGSGYSISDDGTTRSITVASPTGELFFRLVGN